MMVCTGMRVPRRTHAPLTLPGTLSTAGHCDQSSGITNRDFYHNLATGPEENLESRGRDEGFHLPHR